MSILKLILKNIRYYWRQHFALLTGTIISTTILTGALIVGDSVRLSLRNLVDVRLGSARFVLQTGERFVGWELASNIRAKVNAPAAALLLNQGIAVNPDTGNRINRIQVIGIDQHFWELWNTDAKNLASDEAIISENIAQELGLKVNDLFLLRVQKLDAIPMNTPFAQDINLSVALRLRVTKIATTDEMGRFSLKSNQAEPFNVFISHQELSENLGLPGKANAILVAQNEAENITASILNSTLSELFSFDDLGLSIREIPESERYEILSDRIFIDEPVAKSALGLNLPSETVLTYLVNSFAFKGRETPYSFVSAASPPIVNQNLENNQIVINQWLAQDLGAKLADTIELKYFVIGPLRTLKEVSKFFVVKEIIPIQNKLVNNFLMPRFPGLEDAGSCHDWQTGIPIDLKKIRDKDEDYWDEFRGTPKALISMQAGTELWGNPFGSYTAIRISKQNIGVEELKSRIALNVKPGEFGFTFNDAYNQGVKSAENSVDFAGLFIGLSFFLILSAIILTILIFSLHTQSRKSEAGLLAGLGFEKRLVLKIQLSESSVITIFGVILGALTAILYTKLIVLALNSVWQGAVHTDILRVYAVPQTIFIGGAISLIIAFFSVYLVTIRNLRLPAIVLIRRSAQPSATKIVKEKRLGRVISYSLIVISIILLVFSISSGKSVNPTLFLASGGIFLAGTILLLNVYLKYLGHESSTKSLSFNKLAVKNASRNKNRSLATVALLSLGTFIVIITGANRKTFYGAEEIRQSGTGGFQLWTETTLPIPYNLNSQHGKSKLGLEYDTILNNVNFIQISRFDGDDASCLNLNQVQKPAILGVNPNILDSLKSFSFANQLAGIDGSHTWLELNKDHGKNVIPAIADQTVLTWGLMKSVGDTLYYLNETGETVKLLLVAGLNNSIFQGNILISNKHFTQNFPSIGGSKVMLVDASTDRSDDIAQLLRNTLMDYGAEIIPTTTRLAQFNTVENTYLTVFMILGGLGIVIGTIGLGIVLLRNILERRSEVALILAVGFNRSQAFRLLLIENLMLLITGLALGTTSAFIGILPSVISPSFSVPVAFVAILLSMIFISGFLWIYFTLRNAVNKGVINNLREE